MIYFTADTHFGHKNIIKFCDRPFDSVQEMDDVLIMNWNATVGKDDTIYHLGDFSMKAPRDYLAELNGNIVFVNGSHDRWMKNTPNLMEIKLSDHYYDEKFPSYPIFITLCHYAMRSWKMSHYASWHLFGHHHGNLESHGLSFDVGVDCHGYAPVSLDDVAEIMESLAPIVDHRK